jgi:hypothetical protein
MLTYSFYRGSKIASSLADAGTYQIDRKMNGDRKRVGAGILLPFFRVLQTPHEQT